MASRVEEVMTVAPMVVQTAAPVVDAAAIMREGDVGALVVLEEGRVAGIITDRDIVVRVVAEGRLPAKTTVGEVCSRDVASVESSEPVAEAVRLMRERNLRRLPVVEEGLPVGIVSLGDLAVEQQPESALADISAADPNR